MQVEVDPGLGKHSSGRQSQANGTILGCRFRGNHIVIHLNGFPVTHYHDASPKFTDGVIGLQIHTGGGVKMRWKDLYIKEK